MYFAEVTLRKQGNFQILVFLGRRRITKTHICTFNNGGSYIAPARIYLDFSLFSKQQNHKKHISVLCGSQHEPASFFFIFQSFQEATEPFKKHILYVLYVSQLAPARKFLDFSLFREHIYVHSLWKLACTSKEIFRFQSFQEATES